VPSEIHARRAVITAPVPQTLEMSPQLASGIGELDPESVYDKAVLGLARLRHSSEIPDRTLFENPADGIEAVIVESAKFPDRPPSVTIRCDPETSDRLFDLDDEQAWDWMSGRVAHLPFLTAGPEEHQVKRWRYSKPRNPVPAPFASLGPVSACGDGFDTGSGTGLEAALRSAQALLDQEIRR
jgi:predicted NAD/FAD-dependent oxidoreductase